MTKDNKQTYGRYLASFIAGPEPVAPPAGEGGIMAPQGSGSAGRPEPFQPSPAIGGVEKLIERLEGEATYFTPDPWPTVREAAAMLRSLASDDDVATGTIATLRDEIASLRTTLDNMTEEYHHLRAEKARVEEELETEAKGHAEMCALYDKARIEIASLRAKLERAREGLSSIASNTCCDKCQEAALVARATLEEISPSPEA